MQNTLSCQEIECPARCAERSSSFQKEAYAICREISSSKKIQELSTTSNRSEVSMSCDNCDSTTSSSMMWRCEDCCENLCEQCGLVHQRQKSTKSHKVKVIGDQRYQPFEKFMKSGPSFCEDHSDKQLELYCADCKIAVCVLCLSEKHNMHKCTNVFKISEDFR